ncbi:MAG: CAP domain-containing protein, partial [Candidatus Parcubacteria bacterium]|nr:CAP domain-containing protein [Candidatus Parcubacteria bacterium]
TEKLLSDKAVSTYVLIFLFTGIFLNLSWLYITKTQMFADISGNLIVEMTNQTRAKEGLNTLKVNPELSAAAAAKADDMIKNGYFAHFSPTNVSPWFWIKQNGYNYKYAGENLAMNFSETDQVINGWLNSPSHKANLLNNNYQDIGVAVLSGQVNGQNRVVVVQMFGSPKVSSNNIIPKAEAAVTPTTTLQTIPKIVTTIKPVITTSVATTLEVATTVETIGKVVGAETKTSEDTSLKQAALTGALRLGGVRKVNSILTMAFWMLLGVLGLGILGGSLIEKNTSTTLIGKLIIVFVVALSYTFVSRGFFFPATLIMNA